MKPRFGCTFDEGGRGKGDSYLQRPPMTVDCGCCEWCRRADGSCHDRGLRPGDVWLHMASRREGIAACREGLASRSGSQGRGALKLVGQGGLRAAGRLPRCLAAGRPLGQRWALEQAPNGGVTALLACLARRTLDAEVCEGRVSLLSGSRTLGRLRRWPGVSRAPGPPGLQGSRAPPGLQVDYCSSSCAWST